MGVLYKLNVSLMHKSSLFQENKMTQKSKLYNFNMLFECVICLTMLWGKKKKNRLFQTLEQEMVFDV